VAGLPKRQIKSKKRAKNKYERNKMDYFSSWRKDGGWEKEEK
jgi:hypothetical protein